MIGDWVKVTNSDEVSFCIVCGIDRDNVLVVKPGKSIAYPYAEECLEPIPLTAEILEKNGIKLLEVGDNALATPAKHKNRFEKWEIHTPWKDTYLWFDRQAKYWHLHNMGAARLYYVHELQHALKLCKIDKTIEL